ncbi:hydroxyacid dehydrogenase [Cupriavidus sp. 30B13]|uniref:hydroxyacid dehydrogenase n=1 Tax=Cupriavidus sp. 30B13 TaxID=3384241 RepID=UPI003B90EFEA
MSGAAPARARVVLTDPLHPDADAALRAGAEVLELPRDLAGADGDAALRELVREADGLIVRRQLPADLFDAPGRLRAVVRHGVGLDFIPVERATARGLPVANTPEVNANAVAEYAIAAMLAMSRKLAEFDAQVRAGNWQARRHAGARTFDLRGRVLGIVGYGAIGRRLAGIAAQGFGMRLMAHTATPSRLPAHVTPATLETLFAECDFVVVACPLTPHTRGMIHAGVLAHANARTVLVNVGRGPVLREADVADALAQGRLGGAVLDVFDVQPLPADSPLRTHPNVLLTPHLAGMTQDAERAMGLMAADTVLALIRGERPANIVNPEFAAFAGPG